MDKLPPLPPGAVLDETRLSSPSTTSALPALPPGAVLDESPKFTPPQTWGRAAGSFATTANEGIAGVYGLPMDAWVGLENLAIKGINNVAGTEIPQIRPIGGSQDINSAITAVVGRTEPVSELDKNLAGVGRGVGATAATGPLGMARSAVAATPGLLRMLTSAFGRGGAMGEGVYLGGPAGRMITSQFTDDPALLQAGEATGQVLGGAAPGAAGLSANNTLRSGYNVAAKQINRIPPELAATGLDWAAKKAPAAGSGLGAAAGSNFGYPGAAVGAVAGGYAGNRTGDFLTSRADAIRANPQTMTLPLASSSADPSAYLRSLLGLLGMVGTDQP